MGLLVLATGGGWRRLPAAVGFYGGAAAWLLRKVPLIGGASALTLGHVILARSADLLESTWPHEAVHVRQYERWGIFFVPAYFLCMIVLVCRRRHPYFDNPFERQAYDIAGDGLRGKTRS